MTFSRGGNGLPHPPGRGRQGLSPSAWLLFHPVPLSKGPSDRAGRKQGSGQPVQQRSPESRKQKPTTKVPREYRTHELRCLSTGFHGFFPLDLTCFVTVRTRFCQKMHHVTSDTEDSCCNPRETLPSLPVALVPLHPRGSSARLLRLL